MPPDPRLARLRRRLEGGATLTLAEVAALCRCTDRHARRLIEALRREGVPLVSAFQNRRKTFWLRAEGVRAEEPSRSLALTEAEWAALAVAARAGHTLLAHTPHAGALDRALERLRGEAPAALDYDLDEHAEPWWFEESAARGPAPETWRTLETAMLARRVVRADYYTASRREWTRGRRLHPLCFANKEGRTVVLAWCCEKQAIRTLSPAGFGVVQMVDPETDPSPYFEAPEGFDPEGELRDAIGLVSGGTVEEVRLLVEPSKAEAFRRRLQHATQQIEEERPDGRLVVTMEVNASDSLRSFCQGWGTGVTVLAPEELRIQLHAEAVELARRYASATCEHQNPKGR